MLTEIETVPTIPADVTDRKDFSTADIHVHPSGKLLYGSNRGHNSIVIFRIDEATGRLTLVGHETRNIARPRNFHIDPRGTLLFVANQDAGTVTVFRIDAASGQLDLVGPPTPVGRQALVRRGGDAARSMTDWRASCCRLPDPAALCPGCWPPHPAAACGDRRRPPTHAAAVETWREGRLKRLLSDEGWLTVAGLFWLKPGANTFGSARRQRRRCRRIRRPPGPGCCSCAGDQVTVELAAGVKLTLAEPRAAGQDRSAGGHARAAARPARPARRAGPRRPALLRHRPRRPDGGPAARPAQPQARRRSRASSSFPVRPELPGGGPLRPPPRGARRSRCPACWAGDPTWPAPARLRVPAGRHSRCRWTRCWKSRPTQQPVRDLPGPDRRQGDLRRRPLRLHRGLPPTHKRSGGARLQQGLQPALRLHRLRHLPPAAAAEPAASCASRPARSACRGTEAHSGRPGHSEPAVTSASSSAQRA